MRAKVILTNLVIVALLGFSSHLLLKFLLGGDIAQKEEESIRESSLAFEDLFKIHGYALMMKADQLATQEGTPKVWELPEDLQLNMADAETALLQAQSTDDTTALKATKKEVDEKAKTVLHDQAFLLCDKYAAEEFLDFEPWYRKPTIVVLTTLEGTVIARDGSPRELVGQVWEKDYPLIRWALNGRPRWDVVKFRDVIAPEERDSSGKVTKAGVYETKLLLAAAAPVYRKGKLIGALFIGFDVDNGLMQVQREELGGETAIFYRVKGKKGKEFYQAYSTSLGDEESAKQITAALKSVHTEGAAAPGSGNLIEEMAWIQSVVAKGQASASFEANLGDTPYLMRVAPVLESWQFGAGDLVFAVMRDQAKARTPLDKLWLIAIGTAVSMILVVLLGLIVSNSVLKPVEQLEAEIRTVNEGNWEHRWEIKSTEVGGLSYLINQMLDTLMEDDEEDDDGGRQRATTEEEFMAHGSEPTPESLAVEPEEQYYQRTYQELQAAKTQLGEDPNAVTYEQFVAKLKETEQNILAKQPGRMVRFVIQIQGNKINYKPFHIP
ncbi:MAG: hypothetical protein JRG91_05660 [Deltaproteobacteria bacterium]|nr:hypothetical protein [Deltaproteobacteria bacterium]